MPETKRYTAIVEIVEVTESQPVTRDRGIPDKPAKDSRELAKFTVRDNDLEKLKAKLQSHIELVD
jgi:hypothetical protein